MREVNFKLLVTLLCVIIILTTMTLTILLTQQTSQQTSQYITIAQTSKPRETKQITQQGIKTIKVRATGSVKGVPTRIILNLGIETEDRNPAKAYTELIEIARKVIEQLKKTEGVISVETTSITMYYRHTTLTYKATYKFKVTCNIEKAGEILSTAVYLGVNKVYSISYTLSQDKLNELYYEALKLAIREAQKKLNS